LNIYGVVEKILLYALDITEYNDKDALWLNFLTLIVQQILLGKKLCMLNSHVGMSAYEVSEKF